MNKILAFGIGSSVIGMVLFVVGIVTPGWASAEGLGVKSETGLWQVCDTALGAKVCTAYNIGQLSSTFNATRAFAVIGASLVLTGVAGTCFSMKKNSKKKQEGRRLPDHCCSAIFTSENVATSIQGVSTSFGYSFYLIWVQAFFTIGGGGAIIVAGHRDVELEAQTS
ncbi:PREDICTED: uncharacterized protein LOC109468394 [Branchiostoma belcheri]|uniref:Uncharacterized protein LOC109468394 n=1 Tax=Branchiostoma belcheri TaxID=7741 RepID=A0A6P4YCQ6_BRABE|nr:PREDICTED: uncharacterized protein LOC109468394 [Branchiostoma belcheri]